MAKKKQRKPTGAFDKWSIGKARDLSCGDGTTDEEIDVVCFPDGKKGEPLYVAAFAGGHCDTRRFAEATVACVNACAAWDQVNPARIAGMIGSLIDCAAGVVQGSGDDDELEEILRDIGVLNG